jgi:hypothetical protein
MNLAKALGRLTYLVITCSLFLVSSKVKAQVAVDTPVAQVAKEETTPKTLIFLLAGQSNMDGRGDASQLTTEDRRRLAAVQDRVLLYYNHFPFQPLQPYVPPAHTARKFQLDTVFGPELFFGVGMAEAYPDRKILLIKRSLGGTSLYGCWNPYWDLEKATLMNEEKRPRLFEDFISYTKEVLTDYPAGTYELGGMLWVQGETDSGVKRFGTAPSLAYGDNLRALVAAVRAEMGIAELPFVMLQVGHGKVVEGMQTLAKEDPYVKLIPQEKKEISPYYYPKYGPPVGHYTYEGMKRIGHLFFQVYQEAFLAP